ncbi:MAG: hypothetical protein HYU41_26940 [Candidatus Rokubacteria bacterium]|nr:hypothetical protein [Candidatus Rokubacteria bacterium]
MPSTPSPPTDAETVALRALVADILRRASLEVTSPDGRHHARLSLAGEIRFGPVYYRLTIDDVELTDRIFGDSLRWSEDSRLLAAQEWRSTDHERGPTTRVALFDAQRRRHAALPDVRAGFVEHFRFAGPTLTYRQRFYAAQTTGDASATITAIERWDPY